MPDADANVEMAPVTESAVDGQLDPDTAGAWHGLLLRMAGVVPDDLLSEARGWLAEGLWADVAQAIAFAAASGRIPILQADATLMATQLSAAGEDAEVVRDLEIVDESLIATSPWSFSPVRIEDAAAAALAPPLLDLTADPAGLADLDAIDRAAVAAAGREPAVSALYRAWRVPADGSPWPQARRVFIVSTSSSVLPGDILTLTARWQEALIDAGESDPQVEVSPDGLMVPVYHSMAWAHSALLWAEEPAVSLKLARVFDAVDPELGPSFAPDHLILDDPEEIDRLLDYLDGALPVLTTSALMADIVDPEHLEIVPLTFRTDGEWIWTDTISYYLSKYELAPEEDLLAHLRSVDLPPPVSEVALHRVLAFLQRPDDTEPVWVVPETSGSESRRAPV